MMRGAILRMMRRMMMVGMRESQEALPKCKDGKMLS